MVVPIVIGGAVVIGLVVTALAYHGTIIRLIDPSERKKAEHEHIKSQRGLGENVYAFFFGENSLKAVNNNPAPPQNPLTGTPRGKRTGVNG